MDAEETSKFLEHLGSIEPQLLEGGHLRELAGRSYLAWLWRLLPESRGPLRAGILREFELYEQEFDSTWSQLTMQAPVQKGTLGDLLREAGFTVPQIDATEAISARAASGAKASKTEKLGGLILVPVRYGQDVPVDLVLRCLGREGFELLRTALRELLVYRWVEDEKSNFLLGGAERLEADIMVRARFTRREELDFICVLLGQIRLLPDWQAQNLEADFAERLSVRGRPRQRGAQSIARGAAATG